MVVDLSRNSVACNRSVAVKCKETIERYPLMSHNLFSSIPGQAMHGIPILTRFMKPGDMTALEQIKRCPVARHRSRGHLPENQEVQPH